MQSEVELSIKHIDDFCRRWRIEELAVNYMKHLPAASPDLRVRFEPSTNWSFNERLRMEQEFQSLSGQEVSFQRRRMHSRSGRHPMRVLYNACSEKG
jgi:hypothetical protein